MKHSARALTGALATLALTFALAESVPIAGATGTDPVGTEWAPYNPEKTGNIAYPGMYIDFDGDMSVLGRICTLGVVGVDSEGRKVGITAGHCNPQMEQGAYDPETGTTNSPNSPKYTGAVRGVPISDNNHPVYDRNAVEWAADNSQPSPDPIGWIRWVDDDACDVDDTDCIPGEDVDPDSLTDYMVIEFAPGVQLSSQILDKNGDKVSHVIGGSDFKVNTVPLNSSGIPKLPIAALDAVENFGAVSAREPTTTLIGTAVVAPGHGIVYAYNASRPGMIRSFAPFQSGDSGGPVVMSGTGKWVGIISAAEKTHIIPWVNTSARNILGAMALRSCQDGSGTTVSCVGDGFTITNN